MTRKHWVLVCLLLLAGNVAAEDDRVRAILREHCFACHSDKNKASGFSVSTLTAAIAGGNKYGRAVVEGHPEQSVLVRVLRGELQPKMPLGKSLPETEIAHIADWVKRLTPPVKTVASEWRWPFEKPVRRDPPAVKNAAWARNPVDVFILSKL